MFDSPVISSCRCHEVV